MVEGTKEMLQKMFDKYKDPILEFSGFCHDCEKDVSVVIEMEEDGKTTISGGALYMPLYMPGEDKFLKCDACFEKDSILRNYQECEVFSRVVGYLRPVKQWNKGKKSEYETRVNFKV